MTGYRLTGLIFSGFWSAMDWIYPPACAACGDPGYRVCSSCEAQIHLLEGDQCLVCGKLLNINLECCEDCQKNSPPFEALRNLASYDGVIRECMHALKYQNNRSLGEWFAVKLTSIVLKNEWQPDLVIPVPLSKLRMDERGYNQAALIAHPLAARLGLPYHPFALTRIRNTRSQVGLSANQRQVNVAGAFKAEPAIVKDLKVLLIDDVMTTGATLIACAQALKKAGAHVVYCLTIARFSQKIQAPDAVLDTV